MPDWPRAGLTMADQRHWSEIPLTELYPDGRTFYYEGTDPEQFLRAMGAAGHEVTIMVDIPAEALDDFYAADWRVGT
jgi:hypothetical protein